MKCFLNNLMAFITVSFLGIGMANATLSFDCDDDDDVQQKNVQSVIVTTIKES